MLARILALLLAVVVCHELRSQSKPDPKQDPAASKETSALVGGWKGDRYLGSYFLPQKDRVGAEYWEFRSDGSYRYRFAPQLGQLRESKGTWKVASKGRLILEVQEGADKATKQERDFSFIDGLLIINHYSLGEFGQLARVDGAKVVMGAPKPEVAKDVLKPTKQLAPPGANKEFDEGLKLFLGRDGKRDLAGAWQLFQTAANAGHAPSQFQLALYYLDGYGQVAIDRKKAVEWLTKASAQDYAPAQAILGMALGEPWTGIRKDASRSAELLAKSAGNLKRWADEGDFTSRMVVAELLGAGQGMPLNGKEGVRLMEEGAKLGYPPAKLALAKKYFLRDRDYAKSLTAFRELAELGHATAQTFLAGHYRNGRGTAKDSELASQWLSKAAEQNETAAIWLLREGVCNMICDRHNRADQKQTANERDLEGRVEQIAIIRNRLYLDLLSDNGIRQPVRETKIAFGDDEIESKNDAVVEMMAELRVASVSFGRALERSAPLVRGIGNRAGYLKGMEQVYDLSVEHLQVAWKAQVSVARRVWDGMTAEEKAECWKFQARFAKAASGEGDKDLATLDAKIAKSPNSATLYLERARLHELRFDYSRMTADLNSAIGLDKEHSAFAHFLLGRHYAIYGMIHLAEEHYENCLKLAPKDDARIDFAQARAYVGSRR